jgi:hypothetical protein
MRDVICMVRLVCVLFITSIDLLSERWPSLVSFVVPQDSQNSMDDSQLRRADPGCLGICLTVLPVTWLMKWICDGALLSA